MVNASDRLQVVAVHRVRQGLAQSRGRWHKPEAGMFPPTLQQFWGWCVTHPCVVMSSVQVSNVIVVKYDLSCFVAQG